MVFKPGISAKIFSVLGSNKINIKQYQVINGDLSLIIYYEKNETKEEKLIKEKQIISLKASISRREALLANENYVNKAPKELVDKERITLEQEKEKLRMMEV